MKRFHLYGWMLFGAAVQVEKIFLRLLPVGEDVREYSEKKERAAVSVRRMGAATGIEP